MAKLNVLTQAYCHAHLPRTGRWTDRQSADGTDYIKFIRFFSKCVDIHVPKARRKKLYLPIVAAINHSGFETAAKNPITTRILLAIKSRVV